MPESPNATPGAPHTSGDPPAPWARNPLCLYAVAMSAAFLAVIPLSFIGAELGALRNWQTALNALLLAALAWRWWRGDQRLPGVPTWAFAALAACSAVSLLTNQLFKFHDFTASGRDFPIFDRMLFETNHGRFMYAPTVELNHFGIHPNHVLVLLAPLHRVFETPLLLVTVTFAALWGGVVPLWLLARHLWNEGAALLAAAAYLTNPWLAGVLDGGFHPEVLYPLAGLLFLLGWVRERPRLWIPSLAFFLAIKEDAALMMLGFAAAALAFEPRRRRAALSIAAASCAVLALNLAVVQPRLLEGTTGDHAAYRRFWGQYGRSFGEVAFGMASSPLRVAADLLRSHWYRLFGAALFLPLLSRALLPMLPTLLILGTSSHAMMWRYEWYYPVPLLPFLFWGLFEAHRSLPLLRAHPRLREGLFLTALLAFPLAGGGYMRFPIPSLERLRALQALKARLLELNAPEVCAQDALVPHVPYPVKVHPLSAECLQRPGAVAALNPALDTDPYQVEQVRGWIDEARAAGRDEDLGAGFHVVRGLRLEPPPPPP